MWACANLRHTVLLLSPVIARSTAVHVLDAVTRVVVGTWVPTRPGWVF